MLANAPAPQELTGTVTGTGTSGLNCRVSPAIDAAIITLIPDGGIVAVRGPAEGDWIPVVCDGQDGYMSAAYLVIGEGGLPSDPPSPTPGEESASEPAGETPTPPPADAPVTVAPEVAPYPIVAWNDSERSGTANYAFDQDPNTVWSISPTLSPQTISLVADLGQVLPVGRITYSLNTAGMLPPFELWLSEDGVTWWNAAQVNGWTLAPDVDYELDLGLYARYVAIVIPNADQSGLAQIGGIRAISIWPSDQAQTLDVLGPAVTPVPVVQPTPAPEPTPEPDTAPPPTPVVADTVEPTVVPDAPPAADSALPTETPAGESGDLMLPGWQARLWGRTSNES
jgi:hypothetical protein